MRKDQLRFFIPGFCSPFWSFWKGLYGPHLRLLAPGTRPCAVTITVNKSLVASQWQHRTWTVHFHPPISGKHVALQAASTVFHVSSMTRPGSKPSLSVLVVRVQQTSLLSWSLFFLRWANHNCGKTKLKILAWQKMLPDYHMNVNHRPVQPLFPNKLLVSNVIIRLMVCL